MMSELSAVIVGGSNGIGLAITKRLLEEGYFVHICDIVPPDTNILTEESNWDYKYCNVCDFDEMLFRKLSNDRNVKLLMITAGIGRISDFGELSIHEIDRVIDINTVAVIKIMSCFYHRIEENENFYTGVMVSIAGMLSSPMFSVYAASKAAVYRFIESVNIELEVHGSSNRILNVSPGSIKGTQFNGGENDFSKTQELANKILQNLMDKHELFIPEYQETYKQVLQRYHEDPHEYGIHSYNYKLSSGRIGNRRKEKIGYLSGTFDLFHIGHLNILKRAKMQCDYLIVGVHPDASHKGKTTFIPYDERMAIVAACKYVDRVVESCPQDSDAWGKWNYDVLFVGSDYKGTDRFNQYEKYFADKGVEIVYFPYTKGTSSTQIRDYISKMSEEKIDK